MKMENQDGKRKVGLCSECRFMRVIESDRGSRFYQCGLSATDPGFPKYPRLPVLHCRGYQKKDNPEKNSC